MFDDVMDEVSSNAKYLSYLHIEEVIWVAL